MECDALETRCCSVTFDSLLDFCEFGRIPRFIEKGWNKELFLRHVLAVKQAFHEAQRVFANVADADVRRRRWNALPSGARGVLDVVERHARARLSPVRLTRQVVHVLLFVFVRRRHL